MSAPATDSQPPISTLPISDEKAPPTPPDSGPAEPVNEKGEMPTLTTIVGGPPEPGPSVINRRLLEFERRRLQRDTRLARFFTWLLLLGFVILPSTFGKSRQPNTDDINKILNKESNPPTDPTQQIVNVCKTFIQDNRNKLGNTPLYVLSCLPLPSSFRYRIKCLPPCPSFPFPTSLLAVHSTFACHLI
jgi:hypothetical protein